MELASTDIKMFQDLYKSSFGIELDHEMAKSTAHHLIQMMRLVYRPITRDEYEKLNGNYNNEESQQSKAN